MEIDFGRLERLLEEIQVTIAEGFREFGNQKGIKNTSVMFKNNM